MPRKARKAPTASGGAYQNRSDLGAPTQPVSTPTGLPYGQNQQLTQAQQAVPLPQGQTPPGGISNPMGATEAALPAALALRSPTPGIFDQTTRPDEPLTEGIPIGPGSNSMSPPKPNVASTLRLLAEVTGDAGVAALAMQAEQLNA